MIKTTIPESLVYSFETTKNARDERLLLGLAGVMIVSHSHSESSSEMVHLMYILGLGKYLKLKIQTLK